METLWQRKNRQLLKAYCREAGVPEIATHALRHSAPQLWKLYGASNDDVGKLYAHSSESVTRRYIHNEGGRLRDVAKVIRLFEAPQQTQPEIDSKLTQTAQ